MRKTRISLLARTFTALIALSTLHLGACSRGPRIPVDQFELMLTDIMMVNAIIETNDTLRQQFVEGRIAPYESIFEQYGFTRADFDSTLSYYAVHPAEMDEVLDNLVTRLQHAQKSLEHDGATDDEPAEGAEDETEDETSDGE